MQKSNEGKVKSKREETSVKPVTTNKENSVLKCTEEMANPDENR